MHLPSRTMIPTCSFPTTALVVDDDLPFLQVLDAEMPINGVTHRFYDNPNAALEYVNKEYKPASSFINRLVEQADPGGWEHRALDVNIYDMYKEVYNPDRFRQISTIVVDYDMPSMTGLEFAAQILDPNIKIILLTGMADEKVAIDAFNHGLIYQFIRKQDTRMLEKVAEAISTAQHQYFCSVSDVVTHALTAEGAENTALTDLEFVKFFYDFIDNNSVKEFYLFEAMGSFLFLTDGAKDTGLFTRTEEQLRTIFDTPALQEAPALLKDLENYEKMLCYHNRDSFSLPDDLKKWSNFIYPTKPVQGRQQYFTSTGSEMLDLERDKILSFLKYKEQNPRQLY